MVDLDNQLRDTRNILPVDHLKRYPDAAESNVMHTLLYVLTVVWIEIKEYPLPLLYSNES